MDRQFLKMLILAFCVLFLFSFSACSEQKQKAPAKKLVNSDKVSENIEKDKENNKLDSDEKKVEQKESLSLKKSQETDSSTLDDVEAGNNVVEIKEKIFLQKINDIYFNFEDYKDSTIVIEGMFSYFENMDGTETRAVVYREGPGCCGNDGWGGFFLLYDKDFPEENAWIRVTGKPVLEEMKGGWLELYLKVDSLEVKEERGSEFVTH